MIQLGSILAVVCCIGEDHGVAAGLASKPEARRFVLIALHVSTYLVALFGKYVRGVLYGNFVVIAAAFIAGGVIMLVVERVRPAPDVLTVDELPTGRAFAIGAFQALALVPGVSRSGGTIVAGMAMRVDRAAAAEFTFFLAIQARTAAFAKDLLDLRGHLGSARGLEIAVGFVMAFLRRRGPAVPQFRAALGSRRSRGIGSRPARRCSRRWPAAGYNGMLWLRQLHHRFSWWCALHQRRGVHLGLRRRRRAGRRRSRPGARAAHPAWAR